MNFLKLKQALMGNSTTKIKHYKWLYLVKVLVWLYDIPSSERTYYFDLLKRIQVLRKNSGDTWTVGYLKEAHRLVSHWLSGNPDQCQSAQRVAVRGLPLIIPGALRNQMYKQKNLNFFRCTMTMLSLFRVMDAELKLKISTITDPFNGKSETLPLQEINNSIINLSITGPARIKNVESDLPRFQNRLLNLSTSGPNGPISGTNTYLDAYCIYKLNPYMYSTLVDLASHTSHYLRKLLIAEVTTIRATLNYPKEKFDRIAPLLHPEIVRIYNYNYLLKNKLPVLDKLGREIKFKLGKLSTKIEPAGKVRVFAMVDIWTQSILAPIHEAIFDWLRSIPMDGTFDQLSPLHKLSSLETKDRFSFDLSAATDRLPIRFQIQVMGSLFNNSELALLWASVLVGRTYHLLFQKNSYALQYAVGQPMGAYSSWGMLAVSHHVVVQIAASRAGIVGLFKDYAVLGDDICIANKFVANQYLSLMADLGVEINMSKSLVSSTGVAEFAKRWVVGETDVSPTSPSLITRLTSNLAYLPVVVLDLLNRGVHTIDDPSTFMSRFPGKSGEIRKAIKFALLPYLKSGSVSWLVPFLETNSLTQKDLFSLYEMTDRAFNSLALTAFHNTRDTDAKTFQMSAPSLLWNSDGRIPYIKIPSHYSMYDNLLLALHSSSPNLSTRCWYNNPEVNLLTFECYIDYLKDSISNLMNLDTKVPDLWIKDGYEINHKVMRDPKHILTFMNKLETELRKWRPDILNNIPESNTNVGGIIKNAT